MEPEDDLYWLAGLSLVPTKLLNVWPNGLIIQKNSRVLGDEGRLQAERARGSVSTFHGAP